MRDVRDRQYGLVASIDRLPGPELDGASGLLLQTYEEASYPTAASKVYACHPCLSDCEDTEGAAPDLTADTSVTLYAANLGSEVPPEGTVVVAHGVGGRWAFRYDG